LIHLAVLQTIALPFADPVNASISSPISSARIIQDPVLVGTATECFAWQFILSNLEKNGHFGS
jgi:hypothetical protein